MSPSERKEYCRQLLEIQYEDDENYTQTELDKLSDDELKKTFEDETSDVEGNEVLEIDLEKCMVCGETKECPFEDEETQGPICSQCAKEAEADDTLIEDEDAAEEEEEGDDDEDEEEDDEEFDEDDDEESD